MSQPPAPSRAAVRTCCGVGPLLSRCHAVMLSGCDKTQYWTPGPRHLHTLQVTIDINLQLGITGGGGEGPHRKYIICFNTPLCVVAAGVRWLVQASIDRRLPRCQPSSCFLTPAGPDVFLPIPQQPGPCHTVIAHCHTVTLSHTCGQTGSPDGVITPGTGVWCVTAVAECWLV